MMNMTKPAITLFVAYLSVYPQTGLSADPQLKPGRGMTMTAPVPQAVVTAEKLQEWRGLKSAAKASLADLNRNPNNRATHYKLTSLINRADSLMVRLKNSAQRPHSKVSTKELGSELKTISVELEAEIRALKEQLNTASDDATMANIDLQNTLHKQQQTIQTLESVNKTIQDTADNTTRKIDGTPPPP
ncbi:MAG: hypothetical protein OEZ16_00845 [Chromatiales bacterium]|nr:hypothetical protein [Chromatiales bacterium]